MMEEHEEVHSEIRWRRVCALFEEHPLWKSVSAEERKDVFEDVKFNLAEKEKARSNNRSGEELWGVGRRLWVSYKHWEGEG